MSRREGAKRLWTHATLLPDGGVCTRAGIDVPLVLVCMFVGMQRFIGTLTLTTPKSGEQSSLFLWITAGLSIVCTGTVEG